METSNLIIAKQMLLEANIPGISRPMRFLSFSDAQQTTPWDGNTFV